MRGYWCLVSNVLYTELVLFDLVFNKKSCLLLFIDAVLLEVHALSVCIGVLACGRPILIRVVCRGIPSRAWWDRAASSIYVTDAITFCMIPLIVCTAPLCGGDVAEGEDVADMCVRGGR
jgi:hypothetical protein